MGNITAPTQIQLLKDHFRNVGSITGLQALALYRIVSLTKQISVLKDNGLNIVGLWKRDNTGKRYKQYFVAASDNNCAAN